MKRHVPVLTFLLGALVAWSLASVVQGAPHAVSAPAPAIPALRSHAEIPPAVTDNLRELNNKLTRAINRLPPPGRPFVVKDIARERRTLKDLEVTKLRAVSAFPNVFGMPYADTFTGLDCIDQNLAVDTVLLDLLEGGYLTATGAIPTKVNFGTIYASRRFVGQLKNAKACKDRLEVMLQGASAPPPPPAPTATTAAAATPVTTQQVAGFSMNPNPETVLLTATPTSQPPCKGNPFQAKFRITVSPDGAKVTIDQPGNAAFGAATGTIDPDGTFQAATPDGSYKFQGQLKPDGSGSAAFTNVSQGCTYTWSAMWSTGS